jgi:cysteine desulfurase
LSLIYLDYNRTTPIAPSALEAMKPFWTTHFMLPSQDHAHAQAVSEALENAREGLGQLVGCEPFEIVFTSGGTESDNLAIRGIAGQLPPGHLLVGEIEQDSVLGAARALESDGWEVELVPVDADGLIDPDRLADRIKEQTRLACVQLANPVVGAIQGVRQIADLCHGRGVLVHCNATAAFGKIPVSAHELRADTLSISGHKFFGPKGSGALYVRRGLDLAPVMFGEPREMGLRPGAENIPGYVGLGAAATLACKYSADAPAGLSELRDRFVNGIFDAIDPEPKTLCQGAELLPNTVAIELPGDARRLLKLARQVAVATSLSDSPPDEMARTLRAIGRSDSEVGRTISVSIGWTTTRDQIDRAVSLLAEAWDAVSAH